MTKYDIVVIGSSAGGVYALRELAAALPKDFKASIFVVQHLSSTSPSYLPQILSAAGPLKAVHPIDGTPIQPGVIYLAPPDHHLLLEPHRVLVKKGPKENRFRPSIDALFRSAAYAYGTRVIGIILTGLMNDGTSGMWSVKRLGGVGIIQDPEEAMYPSMPESVLEYVEVDYRVAIAELAPLLVKLTQEEALDSCLLPAEEVKRMRTEIDIAGQKSAFDMGILSIGEPTALTCPECHGALVQLREGRLIRYRCHTGHAFTANSLLAEVSKAVEDSLWSAIRGLEETVLLLEQTANGLVESGRTAEAKNFFAESSRTKQQARRLHEFVVRHKQVSEDGPLSTDVER
ncbi:chemotaxis protein CheB [Runella slithyformis]|uniref:protein-glutamate methylesterase n=1 Tax=Runella slithyformis (strain ATCC 29530 / DSM 19594 / LMG 11500 / NCIMB 11436 / LSU 4) TaxID=761193 RepID=A0A7U4E5W6_RUNSL|nr:chemotaxis protein CheB [Runella slithyformis]AEI49001.1 CheB methylesterase [Runella slithyformis DSM 19594]